MVILLSSKNKLNDAIMLPNWNIKIIIIRIIMHLNFNMNPSFDNYNLVNDFLDSIIKA